MTRTRTFLVAIALAWLAAAPVFAGPTETIGVPAKALPEQAKGKPPSFAGPAFRQGVVSVANPHGAEAGAQVLEAGGNAVDAAVAIAYALNVVEPQSAGVGGGGFMMIHIARTGETVMIDTRERAPAGATRDMFVGVSSATQQGRAAGVPGMVKGTALAVQRYGRLPLASSLEPAIRLAGEGFAATPRYVEASCSSRARAYPETAAYFCPGGASRVAVGEIVTNPPLAETFRAIAQGGPDAFYTGDIAKGIVEGQKRFLGTTDRGGSMTVADLANYQVNVRTPYEETYRGYIIRSVPSPSSGGLTLLMMLKMIERFPIGDAAQGFGFGATRTLNVMAEALRIGFADRAVWMGDADFSYVPARGLLHPTYLAMRSAAINPDARMTPNPIALIRGRSTSPASRRAPGSPLPSRPRSSRTARPISRSPTSGATWCPTRTPSSRRTGSACSPATTSRTGRSVTSASSSTTSSPTSTRPRQSTRTRASSAPTMWLPTSGRVAA